MVRLMIVMVGGGMGAATRFGINELLVRFWGTAFPLGTLLANLIGCFLIGTTFGLVDKTNWLTPEIRLFFITGFLGAMTTFSSFALETVHAAQSGFGRLALINFFLNNILGLFAVLGGLYATRLFVR